MRLMDWDEQIWSLVLPINPPQLIGYIRSSPRGWCDVSHRDSVVPQAYLLMATRVGLLFRNHKGERWFASEKRLCIYIFGTAFTCAKTHSMECWEERSGRETAWGTDMSNSFLWR